MTNSTRAVVYGIYKRISSPGAIVATTFLVSLLTCASQVYLVCRSDLDRRSGIVRRSSDEGVAATSGPLDLFGLMEDNWPAEVDYPSCKEAAAELDSFYVELKETFGARRDRSGRRGKTPIGRDPKHQQSLIGAPHGTEDVRLAPNADSFEQRHD
jgi:hypothetical protein